MESVCNTSVDYTNFPFSINGHDHATFMLACISNLVHFLISTSGSLSINFYVGTVIVRAVAIRNGGARCWEHKSMARDIENTVGDMIDVECDWRKMWRICVTCGCNGKSINFAPGPRSSRSHSFWNRFSFSVVLEKITSTSSIERMNDGKNSRSSRFHLQFCRPFCLVVVSKVVLAVISIGLEPIPHGIHSLHSTYCIDRSCVNTIANEWKKCACTFIKLKLEWLLEPARESFRFPSTPLGGLITESIVEPVDS